MISGMDPAEVLRIAVEVEYHSRRRATTYERLQHLKVFPDDLNEDDLDMLRDVKPSHRRWLFHAQPQLRALYEQQQDTPDAIIASFHDFMRRAWAHTGLPGKFKTNWHIQNTAKDFEAVFRGEIERLMQNQPPSTMKSVGANVFFPAWVWAQDPSWGFANFSYSDTIPNRDRATLSRLINSQWYQRRWGHKFQLIKDSDELMKTNKGGWRYGGGVGGAGTGLHPHVITIDDPHKAADISSKAEMLKVLRWFANTISSRGMILRCAVILLMQRLATNDLCGAILNESLAGSAELESDLRKELESTDWVHRCYPMEFDPEHRYRSPLDPRTQKGELLWPEVIPVDKVRLTKKEMSLAGEPNVNAQFQQDPLSDSGVLFENLSAARIRRIDLPENILHGRAIRSWDRAATPEDGDNTAGVLMVELNEMRYVLNVIKMQKGPADRDEMIRRIAIADAKTWANYRVAVEKCTGPDGTQAYEAIHSTLAKAGVQCMAMPATKNKAQRAGPFAGAVKYGMCRILTDAEWSESFLQELRLFPNAANDDQVDAGAHGYNGLTKWAEGKV